MRVLHLIDRVTERGGAGICTAELIRRLPGDVQSVVVAGAVDEGSDAAVTILRALGAPDRRDAPELEALVARERPDFVHVHNVMNPAVLHWAADRGALITLHDHRVFCPGRGKLTLAGAPCRTPMAPASCAACFDDDAYFRELAARTQDRLDAVRRMAAVIALSGYVRDELVATGVARDRVHVVAPMVPALDSDAAPSGPPCVLWVGRLVAAKGLDDAIAAWRAAGADLPLVFCGTGPERGRLERDGFEVLGWVDRGAMAGVYRRARAVLFAPRWQEPLGLVGLEARALGVPVVAWDSGGVREWHPAPVPWGDREALGRALARALVGPPPPRVALPAGGARRVRALYTGLQAGEGAETSSILKSWGE